ncbi:hypothetical protein [Bacteroides cellulosilyticus]|uniref:hypothetical protein n=1 Tax=Bacteroides cellulosilyticus TaxID=246787 RepID=UPI00189A6B4D|nr:hypothetical protein [Bacteroides cellulosilyticus]
MSDNVIRKIDKETAYLVLTSTREIEVRCYVQYIFAHGLTDDITIKLPIGTRFFVELHRGDVELKCNVIGNKKHICKIIEETLDKKFHDMRDKDSPLLCESFLIHIYHDKLVFFQLADATESDLLDMWLDNN